MSHIIKRSHSLEELALNAAEINKLLNYRELVKNPRDHGPEVATVSRYAMIDGIQWWALAVDLDWNGVVCGTVASLGYPHVEYHATKKRTSQCLRKAELWRSGKREKVKALTAKEEHEDIEKETQDRLREMERESLE